MKPTPYEVAQVALRLYEQSTAHPSNKHIQYFIPLSVEFLEKAKHGLRRWKYN